MEQMSSPLALLEEMTAKRVTPSPRSICSLVEAAADLSDAECMAETMSTIKRSPKKCKGFGGRMVDCRKIVGREGGVPTDDRGKEVVSALAFLGIIAVCFGRNALFAFDPLYSSLPSDLTIFVLTATVVGDNIYTVLRAISTFFPSLPDLPDIPEDAPVGRGKLTSTLTRGLSRLFNSDTERECRCEAAHLVIGYKLGLPCFSFRANSLEAAALVYEGDKDVWQGEVGIVRMMVWLWAGVIIEEMKYNQLIVSDPRQVEGLLARLEKLGMDVDEDRKAPLIEFSYDKAREIVTEEVFCIEEIGERLIGGAATVGDCVAYLEGWEGEF